MMNHIMGKGTLAILNTDIINYDDQGFAQMSSILGSQSLLTAVINLLTYHTILSCGLISMYTPRTVASFCILIMTYGKCNHLREGEVHELQ